MYKEVQRTKKSQNNPTEQMLKDYLAKVTLLVTKTYYEATTFKKVKYCLKGKQTSGAK